MVRVRAVAGVLLVSRKIVSLERWRRAVSSHRQLGLAPGASGPYIYSKVPELIDNVLAEGVPFHLGEWLVEPALNRLSGAGTTVQLEPRAVDVLVCLARRAGEVVSRQDLIDQVWDTEFVAYNTLASRIGDLRQALGDSAQQPRYIETIPKRGYRLIAAVAAVDEPTASVQQFPESRAASAKEPNPYPGLAAFTTADAANFFGREAEVAALWRRIISRRLLAVFGPSGVGKSSLLRAGVIPSAPDGWRVVVCQPGEAPLLSLARALAPEFAGDADEVRHLLGFDDPDVALAAVSRWRGWWQQVLIVVDQFEELFTLNPPEVQARFIALLRRLVDAADVHVVLAMRDDFLHECHRHAELAPIFRDVTPLGPPAGRELQRALTEPAARHLYRFEDRFLVDEMVDEVAEERAPLPLLAFAVSRLWELRDHEKRLLTREAYQGIGGVSGALAQHAEETLSAIGEGRLPIVRELFRNLVTGQGTRATRTADELLSVFEEGEKGLAAEVLRGLIDSRLLTSFEEQVVEGEAVARHHRVEVAHESLLSSWPRLVRWRTQDTEGAQLRDELRQAATVWDQRKRPADRLWTGTAYREFTLWRERYPGGLTDTEEAFAAAMTELATLHRRRRRFVVASVLFAAVAVATVTTALWRRSELEGRRAESSKLLALGRLELDDHPTAAVAYALASLELADTSTARRFAVEALWRGPTQIRLGESRRAWAVAFSPDGRWLAVGRGKGGIELWSRQGGDPVVLQAHLGRVLGLSFGPDSDVLLSVGEGDHSVRVWSVATGSLIRSIECDGPTGFRLCPDRRDVVTFTGGDEQWTVRAWPLDGGEPRIFGRRDLGAVVAKKRHRVDVDPTGSWLAYDDGRILRVLPLDHLESAPARAVGTHEGEIRNVRFHPGGELIASADEHGEIRVWSLAGGATTPARTLHGQRAGMTSLRFDGSGSRLAASGNDQTVRIWDLDGPPDADPLELRPGDVLQMTAVAFHPGGRWVATADISGVAVWPFAHRYPSILRGHASKVAGLAIAPDGSWIATSSWDSTVRVWSLSGDSRATVRTVANNLYQLAAHPSGRFLLGGDMMGKTHLIPIGEGETRELGGFTSQVFPVAFSPDGRLAAAGGGQDNPQDGVVRVWDLETGQAQVLDAGIGKLIGGLQFTADGRLAVGSGGEVRLWDLEDGTFRTLRKPDSISQSSDTVFTTVALSRDGHRLASVSFTLDTVQGTGVLVQDLETGEAWSLPSHGNQVHAVRMDPRGEMLATVDVTGIGRVGPVDGAEPHLLIGHDGMVWNAGFSPDGRWVATTGDDGTLRLWPIPDMDTPPFHTLPYDEFLDRLRALTNLRVVEDEQSPTGYSVETGPFPGWETVPTW